MTNEKLRKIIMSALFAALACVATMIIKIPTPGTSGYIHPGDAIVILSGAVLGPVWGFFAAEIGSAMADLIGGYFICEYFMYGAGAAASVPANIIQGVGGLIISAVLYPALIAIPYVRQQSLIFTSKKQE